MWSNLLIFMEIRVILDEICQEKVNFLILFIPSTISLKFELFFPYSPCLQKKKKIIYPCHCVICVLYHCSKYNVHITAFPETFVIANLSHLAFWSGDRSITMGASHSTTRSIPDPQPCSKPKCTYITPTGRHTVAYHGENTEIAPSPAPSPLLPPPLDQVPDQVPMVPSSTSESTPLRDTLLDMQGVTLAEILEQEPFLPLLLDQLQDQVPMVPSSTSESTPLLDSLLDKQGVTLAEILEQEDIITEFKTGNDKLVD